MLGVANGARRIMLSGLNDTMFARPPVYVRRSDLPELWRIAAKARKTAPEADLFLEEFDRLSVASETNDSCFVRLDSSVVYKDLRTKRQRRVRVVRPGRENPEENEVSLLSPIGGALVGLAPGAIFRWADADGRLRAIKVLEIT
jgi:regulator of nucleoside diphosphate kinase